MGCGEERAHFALVSGAQVFEDAGVDRVARFFGVVMRGPKAQRMRPRVRIVDVVIGAGQLASDEESSSCRPWRGNLPSFGPTWLPCIVVLLATILESPWRLMPPSTRSASYPVDGPHLVEEWSPCTVGKESMKVHVMHRVFAGILFDSRGNTPFKRCFSFLCSYILRELAGLTHYIFGLY